MRIFLLLLLIGCGAEDFAEQSELDDLRVLALLTDQPEINAATTVSITPLVSYVNGSGANLDYTWQACPDPGIDFGAEANCDDADSNLKLMGSGSFDTNTLSGTLFTGNATSISVPVPAAAFVLLNEFDDDIQFNGFSFIFVITYTDNSNNKEVTALRRITLSTKDSGDLNTNPSFSAIQFDGSSLSSYPTSKGDFTLAGTSSPESYQQETNVGRKSFTEDLFISWYASSGEFLFNRTETSERNEYDPKGNSGVFVAVFRDNRGGLATQIISF